jgi:hypothetical protein
MQKYSILFRNEIIKTWQYPSFKWVIFIPIILCNIITYKNWQMSSFDFNDVVVNTKDPNPWNFLRRLPILVNSIISNIFVGILVTFIFQIESKNNISKIRETLPIQRGVSNLLTIFTIFFWIISYYFIFASVELLRICFFAKLHPDWGFENFPMNNLLFFTFYVKTSIALFSVVILLSIFITLFKRGFIISSFIPLATTFHWGGYPEFDRLSEFMKISIENTSTNTSYYNFLDGWLFTHSAIVLLGLFFVARIKKIIAF